MNKGVKHPLKPVLRKLQVDPQLAEGLEQACDRGGIQTKVNTHLEKEHPTDSNHVLFY